MNMDQLEFAGHRFLAFADGALFWPARRALLVADLHLEKASWFARAGQMLPPYDSRETLAALGRLVGETQAREIWCLGDSFHDGDGASRLDRVSRALLDRLARAVRWTWITGNHDRAGHAALPGEARDEALVDGLRLRHEARPRDPDPELSGHYHPKWRVAARGRRVARRCFVHGPTKLILPAFGRLTGGLDADCAAIRAVAGTPAAAIVPVAQRLLRFPIGR
jgi:hypothetical protein